MNEIDWTFKVLGMTCISCANRIEKALNQVKGISFVAINLATETGFVRGSDEISWELIRNTVKKTGYDISQDINPDTEKTRWKQNKKNLVVALVFTIPLTIWMIYHMLLPSHHDASIYYYFELLASSIVIFIAGRKTLQGAWIAIRHFHTNMDTLISLGAISSWLTALLHFGSRWNWISIDILSFGAIGAMIMALHLTGRTIESWLRDSAAREIKALLKLKTENARSISHGAEIILPISAVKEGWILRIYPGERIPLDGIVTSGQGAVDEAMISGEPMPVDKTTGSQLTGGSLNLTGVIEYEVTRTGENSFLSQMIKLVQEAQGTKIPIQALADKITSWFVPMVLILALTSGVLWFVFFRSWQAFYLLSSSWFPWILNTQDSLSFALFAFVATLVIACPCALGLATPMALITGTGLAAKKGIIIRNGEAIQTSTKIKIVLLDKTGTLTEGLPKVVINKVDDEYLPIIISMVKLSHHPLSKAISQLSAAEVPLHDIKEIAGQGISANYQGSSFFVGKPGNADLYDQYYQKGQSIVECSKNNLLIGFFVLEDPIRKETSKAIDWIRNKGIIPVMLTGDHQLTARYVAERIGIQDVFAGIMPQNKLDIVRKYQSEGKKVMMIGDGINDAAALKGADIGVAIGSGTDLAMDSSDMILLREGISSINDLMRISSITFYIIRQNLFWAFLYNFAAIPAAMVGWLHPAMAEAAMVLSSVTVIGNSLRIPSLFKRSIK